MKEFLDLQMAKIHNDSTVASSRLYPQTKDVLYISKQELARGLGFGGSVMSQCDIEVCWKMERVRSHLGDSNLDCPMSPEI